MSEPSPFTLRVEHLSIRFGRTTVVRDLSFDVERGTTLGILGPNGSGKTVLFKALIGALPYDGLVRWSPDARLGYIPQKLDVERDVPITGTDFLRARAALGLEPTVSARDALALVGLQADIVARPIGTLSGGQFQRLLFAFALLGAPNVLLLDEPTAGIDAPGQQQLNELLRTLQAERGMTVLFISHELSVVYRYATNVLCLGRGQACYGAPQAVLTPGVLHEMYGTPMNYHVHDG